MNGNSNIFLYYSIGGVSLGNNNLNSHDVKKFYHLHCKNCDYREKQFKLNRKCPTCGHKMDYWNVFKPNYDTKKQTYLNGVDEIYV